MERISDITTHTRTISCQRVSELVVRKKDQASALGGDVRYSLLQNVKERQEER